MPALAAWGPSMAIPRIVLIAVRDVAHVVRPRLRRGRSPAPEPTLPRRSGRCLTITRTNRIDTVRPCTWFRPPTGPSSPAQNIPATGPRLTASAIRDASWFGSLKNRSRISAASHRPWRGAARDPRSPWRHREPGTARWFQRRPGRRFEGHRHRAPCRGSLESGNRLDRTR